MTHNGTTIPVVMAHALSLIDSPHVTAKDITSAQMVLEINYGVAYAPEKFTLLTQMIFDEGWSRERFHLTLKWFLKNKPFPAWTVADWFSYMRPIHNFGWVYGEINKFGASATGRIWKYRIAQDVYGYSYEDDLPFPKARMGEQFAADAKPHGQNLYDKHCTCEQCRPPEIARTQGLIIAEKVSLNRAITLGEAIWVVENDGRTCYHGDSIMQALSEFNKQISINNCAPAA